MATPLDSWLSWRRFQQDQVTAIFSGLEDPAPWVSDGSARATGRWAFVPFYDDRVLIELQVAGGAGPELAFCLHGGDQTLWLDGRSDPIHEANEVEALALTSVTVHDYIRFFFFFVRGESAAFVLVESPDEIDLDPDRASENEDGTSEVGASELRERLDNLRSRVTPLNMRAGDEEGRWVFDCTVAYQGSLVAAALKVSTDGDVEMIDDNPIGGLAGISAPQYPPLASISRASTSDRSGATVAGVEGEVVSPAPSDGEVSPGAEKPEELVRDGDVAEESPRIVISYRSADVPDATDRLRRSLQDRFGKEQVFSYDDNRKFGLDYMEVIGQYVSRCDVLLVVIGDRWVDARDGEGLRLLDDPDDPVRMEIEAGLGASKVTVVPVLMEPLRVPKPKEVPASIAPAIRKQGIRLNRRDTRIFDFMVKEDVIVYIESIPGMRTWGQGAHQSGPHAAVEQDNARQGREQVARAAITLMKAGFTLFEPGRGEEAIAVYDQVIAQFRGSSDPATDVQVAKAFRYKGFALFDLGRGEEALAAYDEVIARFGSTSGPAMDEHVGRALVNKGIMLGRSNRSEAALAVYGKVIARFGDSSEDVLREQVAEALVNKGVALGELGRSEEEISAYDEVISRFVDASEPGLRGMVAQALVYKGITLGQLGRSEEEVSAYEEVISRFGGSSEPGVREQVVSAIKFAREKQ